MRISTRLFQAAIAPSLLFAMATALPSVLHQCTTPTIGQSQAPRITIAGLAPTISTDTTVTSTKTASTVPTAFNFQPSITIPTPDPIPNAVLELRLKPATTDSLTTTIIAILSPSNTVTITTIIFLSNTITAVQDLQDEKWYQSTYWSCVTDAVQTHCGWHEPVLPGGDDSVAGAVSERRERSLIAVGVAVGLVVFVAALRW